MSSQQVYEGFWTNHSISGIWGWTWTLNTSTANFLLVALGIFLGFVGNSLWTIIAFILHQCFARENPGADVHHEVQLILRNSTQSFDAAWEFACLTWHTRRGKFLKPLVLTIVPLACAVGFIVAGIESTKVTAGQAEANDVRLKSRNCGESLWDSGPDDNPNIPNQISFATWLTKTGREARSYVQSCYGNSSLQQSAGTCAKFPVGQIPYEMSTGQPCPFDNTICLTGQNTAFLMDTGYIDSHDILGINSPIPDRISIRRQATCSVLQSSDYSNSTTFTNKDGTVTKYHYLWYGPTTDGPKWKPTEPLTPYSYFYRDSAAYDGFGYQITTSIYNPGIRNVWFPIPELDRTDADVIIFIISANAVSYLDPVDDPLYSAHVNNSMFFQADNLYQVLGCTDQYQICGSGSVTTCTSTNARSLLSEELPTIGLNAAQFSVAELFLNNSVNANMFSSTFGLGTSALLARDVVFSDLASQSLPNNQWQLEASNFFSISLARMQALFLSFTSKSDDFALGQSLVPPTPDQRQYICDRQKSRNLGGYESFTAAAVFITLGIGVFILILGWTVELIFGAMRARLSWNYYSIEQWKSDSWKGEREFVQHRRIPAPSGNGPWSGSYEGVPLAPYGNGYSASVPSRHYVSGGGMPPSYYH